jgi:hypothetical protein
MPPSCVLAFLPRQVGANDPEGNMMDSMEREALIQRCEELGERVKQAEDESCRKNMELSALMKGAGAVLEQKGFEDAARAIFDYCKDLVGATSGYVALLREDGMENEVLFLEAGGLPCDVDPELSMPIRGLRAECYKHGKAVFHNDFMNSEWVDFMPLGHVVLNNVMFAPLILEGKTVGIIGLANKAVDFNENDARMATGFGELAAIALQNSRVQDERTRMARERENLIKDLQKALSDVKKLSGLIPICSVCKKIRDDKGYWNQLEAYIREHSEAEFTHGLCEECARKHYSKIEFKE